MTGKSPVPICNSSPGQGTLGSPAQAFFCLSFTLRHRHVRSYQLEVSHRPSRMAATAHGRTPRLRQQAARPASAISRSRGVAGPLSSVQQASRRTGLRRHPRLLGRRQDERRGPLPPPACTARDRHGQRELRSRAVKRSAATAGANRMGRQGRSHTELPLGSESTRRGGDTERGVGRKMDGRKMGESAGAGLTSFCQPCFCHSFRPRGRLCNPFRVGDRRGIVNPGCADVPRPWATVCNAFGVESRVGLGDPDLRGTAHDRCP